MTPVEWICIFGSVLAFLLSGGAAVISALLGVLYGLARIRDQETQGSLKALAHKADLAEKHVVQLQEQVKPITTLDARLTLMDDKIDRLALSVEGLKPTRKR